jgi:hypothetical protein
MTMRSIYLTAIIIWLLSPGVSTAIPINLAFLGTATQSTTIGSYVAGRAIDGNTGGDVHTLTALGTDSQSWWVTLNDTYDIYEITIWNRTGLSEPVERLNNYTVAIQDSSSTSPWATYVSGYRYARPLTFGNRFGHTILATGNTVGIYMDIGSDRQLGIAEVQVWGWENNERPIPEPATLLLFGTGLIGLAGVSFRRSKK